MADYRLHPITWKNVIDYNWLQLQITITPCLPVTGHFSLWIDENVTMTQKPTWSLYNIATSSITMQARIINRKLLYKRLCWTILTMLPIRERPFNLKGGGYGFFSKKIFWFPMLLKKIFWFWWRKKKIIWFRVFVI